MMEYRTLVVPFDFSDHAEAALATAVDLARRFEAELHLVHVIHLPAFAYPAFDGVVAAPTGMVEVRAGATRALQDAATKLAGPTRIETHVVDGASIADAVCQVAEKVGADLLVMGTHGRTGLAHVFLGSVAERTLRHAPCPVLTVRAPGDAD